MAEQDFNSSNIDDYRDFDFRNLGENEIEVSDQQYRSFPLSRITQANGFLLVEVYYEMFMWDHWIRNYSIKKVEKAFLNVFDNLQIEGVESVTVGVFEDHDDFALLTWNLKMPPTRWQKDVKATILKSVDLVLYATRLHLEQPTFLSGIKRYFVVNKDSYSIGAGTFWIALPLVCGFAFFLGTVKYDADKISLSKQNNALGDTITTRENTIRYLRHNSDSALDILGHMPYNEMTLDTQSFRKIQRTIENAGGALYLNK